MNNTSRFACLMDDSRESVPRESVPRESVPRESVLREPFKREPFQREPFQREYAYVNKFISETKHNETKYNKSKNNKFDPITDELYPSLTGPSVTGPSVTGPSVTGPSVTDPSIKTWKSIIDAKNIETYIKYPSRGWITCQHDKKTNKNIMTRNPLDIVKPIVYDENSIISTEELTRLSLIYREKLIEYFKIDLMLGRRIDFDTVDDYIYYLDHVMDEDDEEYTEEEEEEDYDEEDYE